MAPIVEDLRVFRLAIQKSEVKRLLILLGIVVATTAMILVRNLTGGTVMRGQVFIGRIVLAVVMAGYAACSLSIVQSANRKGRLLPSWAWFFGIIFESLIPTSALLLVVMMSPLDPLHAIAAPAVLLYGMFISANILRLDPKLAFLSGVFAALGHSGVILFAVFKTGGVDASKVAFLASYPFYLLLGGAVAALISRELKVHVITALEAADLKRRTELLQGELKIAREIQQTLFPKESLVIPGFEVVGWCKPANETGGDYYDWCKLPSKDGFVMLGDATGHGLGPALLIASCRAYVRADLPQNKDLAGFMSRLNERLSHDTSGSRYVTFVGALIDEQKGQVKIMSAGHCPALLVRAGTKKVEQVKAHGVPLGVMPGQSYPEVESVQLQHGDRLVVYTDGITEAKRADGEMFGDDRLMQAVIRHAKLEGQAFIDALHQELSDFLAGIALQDDLTILSVRRL